MHSPLNRCFVRESNYKSFFFWILQHPDVVTIAIDKEFFCDVEYPAKHQNKVVHMLVNCGIKIDTRWAVQNEEQIRSSDETATYGASKCIN